MSESLLVAVDSVTVDFSGGGPFSLSRSENVRALENVSINLDRGEAHGIVGESGSGKSTLAKVILGLQVPTQGTVRVLGTEWGRRARLPRRQVVGRVQAVFQNPRSSLDPRLPIGRSVAEGLYRTRLTRKQQRLQVQETLDLVGISPDSVDRYPADFSGGQQQRVAIARAVVGSPEVIIFDEATSSLDVSTQSQIVGLIRRLRRELSLSYFFISHDLAVVRQATDQMSVMQYGKIVESGDTERILSAPQDSYTKQLVSSVLEIE